MLNALPVVPRPMIPLRALIACVLLAVCFASHAADPNKVLRLATSDIDTLDPQQLQDKFSRDIAAAIYEGLYEWDYLNRPPGPAPRTAVALPAISADGKTWTIKVKPGIRFTDDPAFKGQPRELVAQDYVYSIKRYLDPNLRGGGDPQADRSHRRHAPGGRCRQQARREARLRRAGRGPARDRPPYPAAHASASAPIRSPSLCS